MPEHGNRGRLVATTEQAGSRITRVPADPLQSDKGILPEECFDLDGNPALDADWPVYTLNYTDDDGKPASLELPLTFADFAITEGRFRKQFRMVPRDAWNENMTPLVE